MRILAGIITLASPSSETIFDTAESIGLVSPGISTIPLCAERLIFAIKALGIVNLG